MGTASIWEWLGIDCEVALEQRPVTCYIAVQKVAVGTAHGDALPPPVERLIGFACYDVASRGMFGPTGVLESFRGRGIGTALLLTCLHSMTTEKYAYAIIHQVGPIEFYAQAVGATLIEGSDPGIVRRRL
jgi:GNAT superfamily N-acetyltransferase